MLELLLKAKSFTSNAAKKPATFTGLYGRLPIGRFARVTKSYGKICEKTQMLSESFPQGFNNESQIREGDQIVSFGKFDIRFAKAGF